MYYLRVLNNDIEVMIQSMGGVSLSNAYEIAIKEENSLIQLRKITPRPPMPIFLDIQPNMPLQIPSFVPFPVMPTLPTTTQTAGTQEFIVPISSQELQEIKSLLQTFGNKLVSLEKQ